MDKSMKMEWKTYAHLKEFLETEKDRLHKEYILASGMLEYKKQFQAARNNLRKTYDIRLAEINEMMRQLRYAAGVSQGPDVSKEMKEFWGLK